MKYWLLLTLLIAGPAVAAEPQPILLRPAQVFDGVDPAAHRDWEVLVQGDRIAAVGPHLTVPAGARVIDLPGETLMPGMIEGHSHLFLHPYNETSWDDQVLHEPLALRTARAMVHARVTLMAGFTSERDLGTEGAGYADVGLKQAIDQGIVPGPRMLVATRAIVAKGAYGPKGFEPGVEIPQGAEEVSGVEDIVRAVRGQIAAGADVVKLYGDYRWRPGEPSMPTLSAAEVKAATDAAHDAGRIVAVHTSTPEGMRRAIAAGVETIEHGYGGTPEIFKAMHDKGIALCPTLAASDATSRYRGWNGSAPVPEAVEINRHSLPARPRGGRADLHGRRCRRVRAWRECPRDGTDGRGRHAGGAGADRGDVGQCAGISYRRQGRRGEGRPACRPDRGGGRSHPRYRRGAEGAAGDQGRADRQWIVARGPNRDGALPRLLITTGVRETHRYDRPADA